MLRLCTILFLISTQYGHVVAQRSKPKWDKHPIITVVSGDSVSLFNTIDKKNFKPSSEKIYYWFSNGAIGNSQGGVTGKLLHGDFTMKGKKQRLIEKGKFDKGLKTGWWLQWHQNGLMKSKIFWKEGYKEGDVYQYSTDGALKRRGRYKNNLLEGRILEYDENNRLTETRYHNGQLLAPEKIKEKKIKKVETEKKIKPARRIKPKQVDEKARPDSLLFPQIKPEEPFKDTSKKDAVSNDSIVNPAAKPLIIEPKKKVIPLSERLKKKQ
jgi:antitoxin component YwqK of YwqJK toxin-antitoxin module